MSGLHEVSLPDLEHLAREIARGSIPCPITELGLSSIGLGHLAPRISALSGLDPTGSGRLLDAIVAERRTRAGKIELVWTGPEAKASEARDTAVVLRELFASSVVSVVLAGFRFDHGADLLEPLHRGMKERGVNAWFFMDIEDAFLRTEDPGSAAKQAFLTRNWPFGAPHPRFFYDPRAVQGHYASLHAKCVVIDDRRSLVTSANFTDRGQTRNIEVGVLIDDATFSRSLAEQWRRGVSSNHFREV